MTASAFVSQNAQLGRHLLRSRLEPLNSSANLSVHEPETGGGVGPGVVGAGVGRWGPVGVAVSAAGAVVAMPTTSPSATMQARAKCRWLMRSQAGFGTNWPTSIR